MNCTPEKTLIASPAIYNELAEAEEKAVAVLGLLEDVIQPAFGDFRCDGMLGMCTASGYTTTI